MPSTILSDPTERAVPRLADALYHDLLSPAETLDVRARIREMATRVIAPRADAIARGDERVEGFPRDVLDDLARAGPFRIPFPTEVGGEELLHPATTTATAVGGDRLLLTPTVWRRCSMSTASSRATPSTREPPSRRPAGSRRSPRGPHRGAPQPVHRRHEVGGSVGRHT